MSLRVRDRGTHIHTRMIVQPALAWVDGRCSPTIRAHIAQECLHDAKLRAKKSTPSRNKIDFPAFPFSEITVGVPRNKELPKDISGVH